MIRANRFARIALRIARATKVQKVFSEKVSATAKMRQKCFKNASKMGLVLLGKEERSKMPLKCIKKCAEHLWGRPPFGRYRNRVQNSVPKSVPKSGLSSQMRRSLQGPWKQASLAERTLSIALSGSVIVFRTWAMESWSCLVFAKSSAGTCSTRRSCHVL